MPEAMYGKALIDEGRKVPVEMRRDFVSALKIYSANEIDNAGLPFFVLSARHSGPDKRLHQFWRKQISSKGHPVLCEPTLVLSERHFYATFPGRCEQSPRAQPL
jgi:hypothetical protein